MTINDFIKLIEDEFGKPQSIQPHSSISDIIDFNSLNALILITLIKSEFNVNISPGIIRNCKDIADLHKIVIAKVAEKK